MAWRTCVGCGRVASRTELIRIVTEGDGFRLDSAKVTFGRGAWLCPALRCFDRARRRHALERALRWSGAPRVGAYEELEREFEDWMSQMEEKK